MLGYALDAKRQNSAAFFETVIARTPSGVDSLYLMGSSEYQPFSFYDTIDLGQIAWLDVLAACYRFGKS